MTLTATQFNRNCQNFINILEKTELFEEVKSLLTDWKQKNKPPTAAIDTFIKIAKIFKDKEELIEQFNKCLVKEAVIPKMPSTNDQVKSLALNNSRSGQLLDVVYNWLKTEQKQKQQVEPSITPIIPQVFNPVTHRLQQITEAEFTVRFQSHSLSAQLTRIIFLYQKSIITLKEFKNLITPIYLTDPSTFNMMFQYAEQGEALRRKVTIFAPLTDLLDQKYPMQQVGNSYVIIPDGYANSGANWKNNKLQNILNRICVSVPLGSEGSFVIARKNQFEQQLFKNQQQKYQIDQNIRLLKGAISHIQKNKNLASPLLQKLLYKIYPYENVYNIMIGQPSIAKTVILPRLIQKVDELTKCKQKFYKQCEEISNKNFHKSLDYRCFYFRKNDKKFNSTQRWEKQIQLRKKQISQNVEQFYEEITDRESLQHTRSHIINTFDNITKQQMISDKKINLSQYEKKINSNYPSYPHNQTIFIADFQNQEVLNDVLQIILYHCSKKGLLQLLVLKLFKKSIKRTLFKDSSIISFIQMKPGQLQTKQNNQNSNTFNQLYPSVEPLNDSRRQKKVYKDITDQFHDFIEQQIQAMALEQLSNPFEGPDQHTLIGTKTIYIFLRYILTIYQRFLKAKEFSDDRKLSKKQGQEQNQYTIYNQFLAIMIFKLKDQKLFQDYLRKILTQDAFVFFTLDKFILSVTKLISNINNDNLTFKILKDGTKDYEIELKKWDQFIFPTITQQLTRVYRQLQPLFRFTYTSQSLVFISEWQNPIVSKPKNKKQSQSILQDQIFTFMTQVKETSISCKGNDRAYIKNQCEYTNFRDGVIMQHGQYNCTHLKRSSSVSQNQQLQQLDRVKKFIKRV